MPPFLKNYLLTFFGIDFKRFIIPSIIISPPYILWMCYLGSFCLNLVDQEKD